MTEPSRSRLTLRLVGGEDPAGEIPLDKLAGIATEAQRLVRSIGRSLSDRGGPGRTPAHLEADTRLLLVGIHPGSTALEIKGPPLEATLDLGDIPPDAGTQAIAIAVDGLTALAEGSSLPDTFDESSTRELVRFLRALEETAPEFEVEAEIAGKQRRVRRVAVKDARATLAGRGRSAPDTSAATTVRSVEGTLYAVNLHTGRYQIEDDLGHTIALSTSLLTSGHVAPMLDRRVRATGNATLDDSGRVGSMDVQELALAAELPFSDTERFFQGIGLDELLDGVPPLRSMDDLALKGLTLEEADAFLADLDE